MSVPVRARHSARKAGGNASPAFGRVYGFVYSGLDLGLALSPLIFGPLMDAGRFGAVLAGVAFLQGASILAALGTAYPAGSVVTVLADTAIRGRDLDEAKATEAKKLAEEAMKSAKSDIDLAAAQGEFAAMAAQLAAIQKLRKR